MGTLLAQVVKYLEEGPQYYPEDQVTDHPEQFVCAELIREKILHLTHEEIPHSIAVTIEDMRVEENGVVHISAVIFCGKRFPERHHYRKKGSAAKGSGREGPQGYRSASRLQNFFLTLWVKVKKDWRNQERVLKDLGFRSE